MSQNLSTAAVVICALRVNGHDRKFVMLSHFRSDNIFIRFGSKLSRQIVGIPMGSNRAPLVANLFLLCNKINFLAIIRLVLLRHSTLLQDILMTY